MERVKFSLEFIFRASPTILYTFLTSPACLVRWFCDEVDINSDAQGDTYAFFWSGSEEVAQVLEDIEDERIRFKWLEAENEDEYLEFDISQAPVTGETILVITDYCDADELQDQKRLWASQVQELKKEMGDDSRIVSDAPRRFTNRLRRAPTIHESSPTRPDDSRIVSDAPRRFTNRLRRAPTIHESRPSRFT
jgi:uncharacterized protein YndB with AHSA1/START domain